MDLRIHEVAVEAVRELRALLRRIEQHDRDLARQMRRSATSVPLNIAEGSYSTKGTRRARYESALGSAKETLSGLQVAQAWGYVTAEECMVVTARYDHVVGALYKLVHTRR